MHPPVDAPPYLLTAKWLLLLVPIGLGLLTGARRQDEPWRWRIDPLLGLFVASLSMWMCWHILAPGTLIAESMASDFGEYCDAVANMMGLSPNGASSNRSRVPAWVIATLAGKLGIVDAMMGGAMLGSALIALAIFCWGRFAMGRLAGVTGALFMGAITPLSLFSRTVTFYPLITGAFALASAGAMAMARFGHPLAFLAAGFGAALALIFDLRGLLWALPVVGVGLLLALRKPYAVIPLRWAALLLPLVWAHQVGPWAYLSRMSPLEQQADVQRFALEMGYPIGQLQQFPKASSRYVWGHSDLQEIPKTLAYLSNFSRLEFQQGADINASRAAQASRVGPWFEPVVLAGILSLWGLRKHPRRLLALLAGLAPFLSNLRGAISVQGSEWRFLGNAVPFVPVLFGLGFAVLATSPWGTRRSPLTVALGAALVIGLVLGWPATWLGPAAPWRNETVSGASQMDIYLLPKTIQSQATREVKPLCNDAMSRALEASRPVLYDMDNVNADLIRRPRRP